MITHRAGNLIEGADTGVAAFHKGTVQPRAVNAGFLRNSEHTTGFGRNSQCAGKQTGVAVVIGFFYGSLYKRLYVFL